MLHLLYVLLGRLCYHRGSHLAMDNVLRNDNVVGWSASQAAQSPPTASWRKCFVGDGPVYGLPLVLCESCAIKSDDSLTIIGSFNYTGLLPMPQLVSRGLRC